MKPTILLFNGPPGVGKDYFADETKRMWKHEIPILKDKMVEPITDSIKKIFGFSDHRWNYLREEGKNEEIWPGTGITVRQAMIDHGENFIKPTFGEDILVKLLCGRAYESFFKGVKLITVSDCGFQYEAEYVKKFCAHHGFHSAVFRLSSPGKTYDGDSREYCKKVIGQPFFDLVNLKNSESDKVIKRCINDYIEEIN